MSCDQAMRSYYAQRAREYERIYALPERQSDLLKLQQTIEESLVGRRVLDVACGTGFFSEAAVKGARSLLGIDANEETLALARAKALPNAEFRRGDAYALPASEEPCDGALCTFWWSHVPRERLDDFLRGLHRRLVPGAPVIFADNTFVAGESTPIARRDERGNTYQQRKLADGSQHEVLKNYPLAAELLDRALGAGNGVELRELRYYWILRYTLRASVTGTEPAGPGLPGRTH